ncbi:MAG TPA: hypothetical protein VJ385_03790 [Fibrobacteria bacterium]|nr:hypothetical protein [Fibrobacteria bacterium]
MAGKTGTIADWLDRTRKPINWIYCSAVLFPLAFAIVASLITTARNHTQVSGSLLDGLFASFFVILMAVLSSVLLTVLPTLLIWLIVIQVKPDLDENKLTRYLGLVALLAIALFSHSRVNDRPFNPAWLGIATLAVVLPRLALPSLRDGLRKP